MNTTASWPDGTFTPGELLLPVAELERLAQQRLGSVSRERRRLLRHAHREAVMTSLPISLDCHPRARAIAAAVFNVPADSATWHRELLAGSARWSMADLRGSARRWRGSYARSRARLLERIEDALSPGWRASVARVELSGEVGLVLTDVHGFTWRW